MHTQATLIRLNGFKSKAYKVGREKHEERSMDVIQTFYESMIFLKK